MKKFLFELNWWTFRIGWKCIVREITPSKCVVREVWEYYKTREVKEIRYKT